MDAWNAAKPETIEGRNRPCRRIVSTDPTTEALGPILADNPRGLIVAPDEMTKWVMSMDQYKGGKGGDRPFYLSAWNGEPVYIDRAKHMREPIVVPHPFLTVVGGMTPDMLLDAARGDRDAMTGSWPGCCSRIPIGWPGATPRKASRTTWPTLGMRMALALWRRTMRDAGRQAVPHVVTMTPEAAREWSAWCQAHYAEQEADDFPDSLEGPWGKLEAYAARLALILHLMHLASDPTRPAPGTSRPTCPAGSSRTRPASWPTSRPMPGASMPRWAGRPTTAGTTFAPLVRWILRNELESDSPSATSARTSIGSGMTRPP